MENMKIDKDGEAVFVSLSGELTLEVTDLIKGELEVLMQEEWKILVFELSQITFMDSSGIGFLVSVNNQVKQAGRQFYLYKVSSQTLKTLKLVNLYSFFNILGTEEDLLAVIPV